MPKKKPTPAPRFDSVGWTFFAVLTLVMCVPGVFLAWLTSYETTKWYVRIGVGLTYAGFASAILTWIINSALQYRAERLKKAQRSGGGKRK